MITAIPGSSSTSSAAASARSTEGPTMCVSKPLGASALDPVDIYDAYRPATWTYDFARLRDPTEPGEPPANAEDPLDPDVGIVAYRPA